MIYESFEAVQERQARLRHRQWRLRLSKQARHDVKIIGGIFGLLAIETVIVFVVARHFLG